MRVAITGGSGSLGTALLARLTASGVDRLVTFSRDEHKRQAVQAAYDWHPGVRVFAGDVRDPERLPDIFAGCEVVIHAAARKVVCGHFDEPREHHLTNVVGTQNVLTAARRAGVSKVLFISSDKAVHPQNAYGKSKALAEDLVIAENARSFATGTRCSVIRYGNVLGSNGSVVRVWRERAARGETLSLSDARMTRFWWTVEDAAAAAIEAVRVMRGGELLLPRLRAAPVTSLLEAVAPASEFVETGIRPGGEKLHEALVSEDEARRAVQRNDWIIVPPVDTAELWDRSAWLGDPVGDGFEYRSDTWPNQWTVEGLREILDGDVAQQGEHAACIRETGVRGPASPLAVG